MSDNSIKKVEIRNGEEFIRLGQALKKCGVVFSGVDAKELIQNGEIKVDGEVETRRGRKLREGNIIEYDGSRIEVIMEESTDREQP